jgi:TolB protein
MDLHANAALSLNKRRLLAGRVVEDGWTLTETAALETHPVWSPDGRRIAFTSDRHAKGGGLELLGPAFELYTMRADGRGIRRLTRNRVPDLHPNWQPIG